MIPLLFIIFILIVLLIVLIKVIYKKYIRLDNGIPPDDRYPLW